MGFKAEITVFLTLLFGIMSALILTVIESAENMTTRIEVERNMQTAIHSCFSEYNQNLFMDYDIFAIDCSYRRAGGTVDNIRHHLQRYAEINSENEGLLSINETKFRRYELLSDNNAAPLLNQIFKYMKNGYYLPYKSTILDYKKHMEVRNNREFMEEFAINLEKAEYPGDNPAETIYEIATGRILWCIGMDENDYKTVPDNCPSRRSLNKGTFTRPKVTDPDESYLITSYIMEKFSDSVDSFSNTYMNEEKEYIIAGYLNGEDCLNECVEWILAQREIKNLNAMMENKEILEQTEELSHEMSDTEGGNQYYIQLSLIYAWAYVESVLEVKCLYENGFVDMSDGIKETVVPLECLEDFTEYSRESVAGGDSYSMFLAGMLMNIDSVTRLKRCMDIIELNMIHAGHSGFKIDGCVTYFKAFMSAKEKHSYPLIIEREFGY